MALPVRLAHPTWRRPAGRAGERPAPALAPPLPGRAASAKSRNPRCCCRFRAITSQVARARRVQAATYPLPTAGRYGQPRAGSTLLSGLLHRQPSQQPERGPRFTAGRALPRAPPHARLGRPCSSGTTARFTDEGTEVHITPRVRPGTHPAGSFFSKGPVAPCRRPHEEGGARQAVRELRLPEPWFRG